MSRILPPRTNATLIDFDTLKAEQLYLHTLLSRATGFKSGQHKVDIAATNLAPEYKMRLAEWSTFHKPAPAAPTVSMAQIEMEEKQDLQRRGDEARATEAQQKKAKEAALQRAKDYIRDAGLVDSKANGALVRKWIEENGGIWSPSTVDDAITALNDKLEWKDTTPPEVLGVLSDGTQQFPTRLSTPLD
jgi:hypothetical protein